jgi:hypothetical protein
MSSTKRYTQIWPTWPAPIYEWQNSGFLYIETLKKWNLTGLLPDCLSFLLYDDVSECPLQNCILRYGPPDRHPYTSGQNSGFLIYWDTQKMKIDCVAPGLSWFPFVWWCIWVFSTKLYTQIWPTRPAPIYEWSELGIFKILRHPKN